mgnify:FL=1
MRIIPGNPRHLSVFIAAILAAMVFVISLFVMEFTIAPSWIVALALALTTFVVVFLSLLYTLNRFIYDKIRLIYKSIRSTKLGRSERKLQIEKGDVLENVSRDVEQWTRDKANEIEILKKNEEFRREFIGNVSHELKTPITTIQGYVLTLLDGGLHDDEINEKYLQRAAKNIDRLIAIVNDLDEISKLESGTMKMNFVSFNFSALVKDVFEFMEIKAEKRRIVLDYKNQSDTKIMVHADPDRIRQVLINLIDNSLKYGNRFGSTTISAFDMDEYYLIEIADNGIGIDQADLPRIFERFYRTEKSRSRKLGGTGLGLAIVKHIIEAHQQTIHVRSKIDVGTTFSFTLAKATK